MADNVKVLASTDPTAFKVATDEIGGTHYPLYKQGYGADGAVTLVSPNNPLPVFLAKADSPVHDAFGRVRVSNPTTIFDSKMLYDDLPLIYDDQEVSGATTTSTHSTATAMVTMGVAVTTAGNRVRQTFRRFNYQPGKSQFILMTGVFNLTGGGAGISQCIGIYDANNGLFFQDDEGTMKVVQRSKTSGSVVDTKVAQSSWNLDKMDGTGPSGITADFTKAQIYIIDFEWLGTGTVRFCMAINSQIIGIHAFHNANSLTSVYMSTPNLPIRYEIANDGNGAATTMGQICSTVISEGGLQETGILFHRSTAGASVSMATENTLYAIVGLRLKATHLSATILLDKISVVLQSASDDIEWVMVFNPSIAGTPGWTNKANSAVQYFLGESDTIVTNGTHIDAGYVSTGTAQSFSGGVSHETQNALLLGSLIDGTPQTIVLSARPINGSSTSVIVEGGFTWRELS